MLSKRKKKKEELKLLADALRLQQERTRLKKIIDQSIEPSEAGRIDLIVAEMKYFYVLREARYYRLNMSKK